MSDKAMLVLGEASESDDEDLQQVEVRSAIQCYFYIQNTYDYKSIMIHFRTQEVEWSRATTQSVILIPIAEQPNQVCHDSYLNNHSLLNNQVFS